MKKEVLNENKIDSVDNKFKLPNKKIIIKFIPRSNVMINGEIENHIAKGGMLTGAVCSYSAPLQRNGTVVNVLSNEEKELLEEMTNLNLSVYGDFWRTFKVRLIKDNLGQEFNLLNPIDYISYKILKSLTKFEIAPSWADRNRNLDYKFAITEADEVTNVKNKVFNTKREAFKAYTKIESNAETLVSILKLLSNAPISKNTSLSVLQDKVGDYVDNQPEKFLSVVNDANFETKKLILDGVESGFISKTGSRYVTKDGLELCESGEIPTFANAVRYLDAIKNQDTRMIIEAKIYNN